MSYNPATPLLLLSCVGICVLAWIYVRERK